MSRAVFVSPHIDDAVFSCGSLIAAAALAGSAPVILTVCAGIPPDGFLSALDDAAGFASSADAVRRRRQEDNEAAKLVGAAVVHLDVLDGQYDADPARVAGPLGEHLALATLRGDTIFAPVGIRHVDHVAVAAACAGRASVLYEEIPYYGLWPEQAPTLGEPTLTLAPCAVKRAAVACYRSQLGPGGAGESLDVPERYHRAG